MPKVSPDILRWAREGAGLTEAEAAQKIGLKPARGVSAENRLRQMESGEASPSRPLLVRIAKQYRRPLLSFYLARPPRTADRGQDFRTLPDPADPEDELLLDVLLRDMRARQALIRAALEDEDDAAPLPFVGSVRVTDGTFEVLASLKKHIALPVSAFRAEPECAGGIRPIALARRGARRLCSARRRPRKPSH